MKTPNFGRKGPIGLVVALAAALLVPAAGVSKDKAPAGAIPKEALALGMKEAPAVVQAMNLPCQVSEARKLGEEKKTKTSFYEVACGPGAMGYVLQAPAAGGATAFSCIEANTPAEPGKPPTAPCLLPGNANPNLLLANVIKAAGSDCALEQARFVGRSAKNSFFEAACQGGVGYIVVAGVPFDPSKPAEVNNCLRYDQLESSNISCTLTDKAARLAVVDKYAAAANNGCVVKDRRYAGVSTRNAIYYEAACQDGKGYLYQVGADGALTATFECSKAANIVGGCTLTDAREAASEQAGLYTKLAQGAGGKCEVDRYALFPTKNPREEVVELVCKDGSGAILMAAAGQKGALVDCGRAPVAGYKCSLAKDPNGFGTLTADLKRLQSDTTCQVSNSRLVGKGDKGTYYMEVACADKLKGYVIEYSPAPQVNPVSVRGCAFFEGCKLPGNT